MRLLLSLLSAGALAYLGIGLLLFLAQGRLVHLPEVPGRELEATPGDRGWTYRELHIPSTDDVTLHGWWIAAEDPRATVVFFHGNAGNISHRLDTIDILRDLGLDVVIFDYRGYGRSDGRAHERGLHDDARAVARWVQDEAEVPANKLIFHGRSLGGALAASAAREVQPAALILESTFTSARDVARDLYPIYPARLLTRLEYATADYLAEARVPALVVHSPDDEIVPFHHAESLVENAPADAELLRIRGDHNTGFRVSGEVYTDGLERFLGRHLSDM